MSIIKLIFNKTINIILIVYYRLYDIIYRPNRNTLTKITMPVNIQAGMWLKDKPLPSYRYEFSMASVENKIYVVGGVYQPNVWFPTNLVESYDVLHKKWESVPNLPIPIHHTAVVSDKRYLYVVGGNRIRIMVSGMVFRFDTISKVWEKLPDMPTKRGALGAGIINNVLYAAGGADYGKKYKILEGLDLKTFKWKKYPDMKIAREHHTCTVSPLGLHVLGGYNTNRFGSISSHEIYDPAKKRWTTAMDIPLPICGTMSASYGNYVYLFAGEQGWAVSKYNFRYHIYKKIWERITSLSSARYAGSTAVIKNKIHVIGGCNVMFSANLSHSHDVFVPK